ncbi:MAG: metallophosphoesterase family protein [Bacteroidales bacterium]|nr:metallophosphoesterase family protein [Bacteroidales bacterium]
MVDLAYRIINIKSKDFIDDISKTSRIAFLLSILTISLLSLAGRMIFESNDDMAMIAILSGRYGDIAIPDGIFISSILSHILYFGYNLFPSLPWYSAFMYFCQIVACFLFYKNIIRVFKDNASRAVLIIVFISLYSYMFYRLNFASTSLFLWFSVVTYVFVELIFKPCNYEKRNLALLSMLLSFSYFIRPTVLPIALILSLPFFVTLYLLKERSVWLSGLPQTWGGVLGSRTFLLSHGSPWDPMNDYLYPDNPKVAKLDSFNYQVIAFGQTHRAFGRAERFPYLLNPGSIGQARDIEAKASLIILDTETMFIEFLRRSYDVSKVVELAKKNGAGEWVTKHLV